MSRKGVLTLTVIVFTMVLALAAQASAEFTVARFVVAQDVADREPVGVSESFPASTEKVYCFLEAQGVSEDAEVSVVWYHEGDEVALVTLVVRAGDRWRTWSSKQVAGRTGKWKVVLKDANGNEIKTAEFTVE